MPSVYCLTIAKQQWPLFKLRTITMDDCVTHSHFAFLNLARQLLFVIFIWLLQFYRIEQIAFFYVISEERMHFGEQFNSHTCCCMRIFSHSCIVVWSSFRRSWTESNWLYKIYHCLVIFFIRTHPVCTLYHRQSTKLTSIFQALTSHVQCSVRTNRANYYCAA